MITVLGSINLDLIAYSRDLPRPGETIAGTAFASASGGKGANQAMAVLRGGGDLEFIGAVGADQFAASALSELKKEGADLTNVRTVPGSTGIAIILVAANGENMITTIAGANHALSPADAEKALTVRGEGDWLLLQLEVPDPTNRRSLEIARRNGVRSVLNIAPYTPAASDYVELADYVIANQLEFAALTGSKTGEDQPATGNVELSAWAVKYGRHIIVTLGPQGVLAATPAGEIFEIAAPEIVPVDTVGAGDTFCGYFTSALAAGLDLPAALARAVWAGSLACLQHGAQPAVPTLAAVEEFISRRA